MGKIFIYTLWESGPHVVREITNGGVGNAASELSFSFWLAMSGFTLLGRCFIASLWPWISNEWEHLRTWWNVGPAHSGEGHSLPLFLGYNSVCYTNPKALGFYLPGRLMGPQHACPREAVRPAVILLHFQLLFWVSYYRLSWKQLAAVTEPFSFKGFIGYTFHSYCGH